MRANHLKGWIAVARKKEKEEVADKQEKPTEGREMPRPYRVGREGMEESI